MAGFFILYSNYALNIAIFGKKNKLKTRQKKLPSF